MDFETIIVGAGAAGMNAALKLQESDREYLLLSADIGGRIHNDEVRRMNYGAVFYFGTYKNMLASDLLIPGPDVLPSLTDGCCWRDSVHHHTALSPKTGSDAPSLLKYMQWMREEFIPRYTTFKDNCEVMEVQRALEQDPLINQLYHETAEEMIERMGFGPIADDLVSMFAHACTGTKIRDLSALDYLNTVQPLTMKIPPLELMFDLKRFDFDHEAVQKRLSQGSGTVEIDLVTKVEKIEGGWAVETEGGKRYACEWLVMATPAVDTQRLLAPVPEVPDFEIREASQLYGYLIHGQIKQQYTHHSLHIFNDQIPIIYIARRFDGDYEVFTEIDFVEHRMFRNYFDDWEVVGSKYWSHALYTHPNLVLPQNMAEGLIMAGDHNGLGMEPAAISGIYAANKIMGRTVD